MTWLRIAVLVATFVTVMTVFLVLILCRAAKLSEEVAERCNQAWLIGPDRDDGQGPRATCDLVHDRADALDP